MAIEQDLEREGYEREARNARLRAGATRYRRANPGEYPSAQPAQQRLPPYLQGYYAAEEATQRQAGAQAYQRASGNPVSRTADFINRNSGTFNSMGNVPRGLPRFLGSRTLLFVTWLLSMVLISSNEVNNGFIPPRPLRLWYASLVYFVLFLVSQVDSMVPVCNALGIGYVVTLGYENISGNAFTLFGIPVSGSTGGYGAEAGGLIAQGANQIAKNAKNLFGNKTTNSG